MELTEETVDAFLEGRKVEPGQLTEIERQIDDPDSLVSLRARRIAQATRHFASNSGLDAFLASCLEMRPPG